MEKVPGARDGDTFVRRNGSAEEGVGEEEESPRLFMPALGEQMRS